MTISQRLTALSRTLEVNFDFLAKAYPALLEEVKSSKSYAEQTIRGVKGESGAADDTGNLLRKIIDGSLMIISGIVGDIREASEEELRSLVKLNEETEKISRIKDLIDEIIDQSGALELYAMNSMIHAIKVGKGGGGFYHIADAMKSRTNTSLALANTMAGVEGRLVDLHQFFVRDAEELNRMLNRLSDELDLSFREKLENIRSQAGLIVEDLADMTRRADEVHEPLYSLMERIQHQDIIRQSLDQVLSLIKTVSEGSDRDALAYNDKVLKISRVIIDDIMSRIGESRVFLLTAINEIERRIANLNENKEALIRRYLDESERQIGVFPELNRHLRTSETTVIELAQQMDALQRNLTGNGLSLLGEFDSVCESSTMLQDSIEGFWNITIAAKIESAKQASLAAMAHTVRDMEDVITTINSHVDETMGMAEQLKRTAEDAMDMHDKSMRRVQRVLDDLKISLQDTTGEMSTIVDRMKRDIASLDIFSDDFLQMINASRERMDEMERIIDEFSSSNGEIAVRLEENAALWEREHGTLDIESWTIQDGHLKELINDFTIFSNKSMAGRIANTEIEREGSREGEVTLF